MIRIEFIFSRFKSILLGASSEGFRKQSKEGKSLFTLRGLVSSDANKTSSELSLGGGSAGELHYYSPPQIFRPSAIPDCSICLLVFIHLCYHYLDSIC